MKEQFVQSDESSNLDTLNWTLSNFSIFIFLKLLKNKPFWKNQNHCNLLKHFE